MCAISVIGVIFLKRTLMFSRHEGMYLSNNITRLDFSVEFTRVSSQLVTYLKRQNMHLKTSNLNYCHGKFSSLSFVWYVTAEFSTTKKFISTCNVPNLITTVRYPVYVFYTECLTEICLRVPTKVLGVYIKNSSPGHSCWCSCTQV